MQLYYRSFSIITDIAGVSESAALVALLKAIYREDDVKKVTYISLKMPQLLILLLFYACFSTVLFSPCFSSYYSCYKGTNGTLIYGNSETLFFIHFVVKNVKKMKVYLFGV